MGVQISPSILSADFGALAAECERVAGAADWLHVDVMDNHFVPNLTFGPQMVGRIQDVSKIPLDVHLMIDNPDEWGLAYAELGAYSVTFHIEAVADPVRLARRLRAIGSRAGIALKPGTPVDQYLELLPEFDQVLVMTVEPGFGGQKFMAETMPKLARLREAVTASGLDVWLQVDGGVTEETIVTAAENGADTFVAGSSVFRAENPATQIDLLRKTATAHLHN